MVLAPRRLAALSITLLVALAACGDDATDPASSSPDTVATPGVEGRIFLSTSSTGFEIADGSVIRLGFDAGNVSATGGCNNMFGGYAIDGDTLQVETMASTEMACEQPLMDQDTRLAEFLASSPTIALIGDELTLTSGDASLLLLDRVVADPDRPLEETLWTVTTVITGDAAMNGWGDAVATMTITGGTAQVSAGCNTGSAEVTVADGSLTFGPLALTKMACDEAATELENAVIATLTGTATYEIEAGSLILTNGTDGLQFTAP